MMRTLGCPVHCANLKSVDDSKSILLALHLRETMFDVLVSFSRALRHFQIRVAKFYYLGIVEPFEDELAKDELAVITFFKFTHVMPLTFISSQCITLIVPQRFAKLP